MSGSPRLWYQCYILLPFLKKKNLSSNFHKDFSGMRVNIYLFQVWKHGCLTFFKEIILCCCKDVKLPAETYTFKEKQLLLSLPNQGSCVDRHTHKKPSRPLLMLFAYSLSMRPFKITELVASCQFSSRKTFKFTASMCSQNWLWAPQSVAGSNPALGVLLLQLPLLSRRFKASAGHLEGVRRSALMHSLFLQMKVGKMVWFPVTHSPSSFWSVLTDPKFGEVCLGA